MLKVLVFHTGCCCQWCSLTGCARKGTPKLIIESLNSFLAAPRSSGLFNLRPLVTLNIHAALTVRKSRSQCVVPSSPLGRWLGSLPRAWQMRQNIVPDMPIWDAISLAIGLSPVNARIHATARTSSLVWQSHTSTPSSRKSLSNLHQQCLKMIAIRSRLTVELLECIQPFQAAMRYWRLRRSVCCRAYAHILEVSPPV